MSLDVTLGKRSPPLEPLKLPPTPDPKARRTFRAFTKGLSEVPLTSEDRKLYCNLFFANCMGMTPLHEAASNDDVEYIQWIASIAGARFKELANFGGVANYTPLMEAATWHKYKAVKCLIKLGANIHSEEQDAFIPPWQRTALGHVLQTQHDHGCKQSSEIMKILLRHGALAPEDSSLPLGHPQRNLLETYLGKLHRARVEIILEDQTKISSKISRNVSEYADLCN